MKIWGTLFCSLALLSSATLHPTKGEIKLAQAGIQKPMHERASQQPLLQPQILSNPYYHAATHHFAQAKVETAKGGNYAPVFLEQAVDNLAALYHQTIDKGARKELQVYMVRTLNKTISILEKRIDYQEKLNANVARDYMILHKRGITDLVPENHDRVADTRMLHEHIASLKNRRDEVLKGNPSSRLLDNRPVELNLPKHYIACDVPLADFGCEMPENPAEVAKLPEHSWDIES